LNNIGLLTLLAFLEHFVSGLECQSVEYTMVHLRFFPGVIH